MDARRNGCVDGQVDGWVEVWVSGRMEWSVGVLVVSE